MKPIEFFLAFSLAILMCCALWSCKDDISSNGATDIVFPDTNVRYGRHVEPLFYRTCAFSPCHSADAMADGLSLATYQDVIFSKPGVVRARDTLNSRLIWRVEGTHGVAIMPLDRQQLTPNQIKGLKTWILEGAQNN